MKARLLFFTLFIGFGMVSFGQTFSYEVDEPVLVVTVDPSMDHDFKIDGIVTNLTNRAINLRWTRTIEIVPSGWESAVCDPDICHFPVVSTESFELAGGAEGDMDAHVYNNMGLGDTAVVEVCVHQEGDSAATVICHEYTVINDRNSSTEQTSVTQQDLSISPNPVANSFTIDDAYDAVGRIEVYSMIGSKVATLFHQPGDRHDVAHLASGVYLVRLFDRDSGRVLGTKRMQKQ